MKIVSKKRDYYDAGQIYHSIEPLYIREEKEIKLEGRYLWDLYESLESYDKSVTFSDGIIGFCGKLYPYICTGDYNDRTYLYSIEQVDHFLEKNHPKLVEEFTTKRSSYHYTKISWKTRILRDVIVAYFTWFTKPENKQKQLYSYFDSCPIFSVEKNGMADVIVTQNCLLRPFQFYKVFGVAQAFQELEMWMSNIAKPIKPIPHIDDVTMAEAKGYDKFSFRKEKKNVKN